MVYYCGVTSEFITDEKNLGPTIGGASQSDRNRDGVDRDGDGVINDGTEDERPAKKKKRDERRDYANVLRWLRLSVEKGNAATEYATGFMFRRELK